MNFNCEINKIRFFSDYIIKIYYKNYIIKINELISVCARESSATWDYLEYLEWHTFVLHTFTQ